LHIDETVLEFVRDFGLILFVFTIGLPDAGVAMSGGDFSVTGGFWSLISAVQTIGSPALVVTH
jgi:uncharacterized transporter YbjL